MLTAPAAAGAFLPGRRSVQNVSGVAEEASDVGDAGGALTPADFLNLEPESLHFDSFLSQELVNRRAKGPYRRIGWGWGQ